MEREVGEVRRILEAVDRITMPKEDDQKVRDALRREMGAYQADRNKLFSPRTRFWHRTLSVVLAAVFLVVAGGFTYFAINKKSNSPAVHTQKSVAKNPTVHMTNIHYSASILNHMKNTAQKEGVKLYLPHKVLPGSKVEMVKPGTKGMLIEYTRVGISEGTNSSPPPKNATRTQRVQLANGQKATVYRIGAIYHVLYMKKGDTYIVMENMSNQKPPSKAALIAIANSLYQVR